MRSRRTHRRSSGLLLAIVFLSNLIVPHAAPSIRTTKANSDAPAPPSSAHAATPARAATPANAANSSPATTSSRASDANAPQPVSSSQSDSSTRAASAFARLPLRFEANQGQTDPRVKFLARGDGYNLFLTPGEAVLSLNEVTRDAKDPHAFEARAAASEVKAGKTRDVLRMKFVGADASASVAGVEELPGRSNYFKGADSAKWQADVRAYARVRYAGIYPGVDLTARAPGRSQATALIRRGRPSRSTRRRPPATASALRSRPATPAPTPAPAWRPAWARSRPAAP